MRVADKIELDAQVGRELRALSKRRRVEGRVQQRASVILLAAILRDISENRQRRRHPSQGHAC